MPATSPAQQRLFAIAEHNPSALYKENKDLAKLPHKTLHEFAHTSYAQARAARKKEGK
jgi:hypothetical protein